MKGSIRIASFAGIGVYVHWTFSLLVAFVLFSLASRPDASLPSVLTGLAMIAAVFLCVVLHEFGHALTARRFGVQTRDITLLPIGGMARMDRIPEKPLQEIAIALAGPAVNVAIALLLSILLIPILGLHTLSSRALPDAADSLLFTPASFLPSLIAINILLVLFNLIPAFPMDGGRVFRALLALFTDYVSATNIAARLGQALAILFAFTGLFLTANVWLVVIGVFIFLAGTAEANAVRLRAAYRGRSVRDAMITRFVSLHARDPIAHAVDELLAGSQTEFPVLDDHDRLAGLLTARDLLSALAHLGPDAPVANALKDPCLTTHPDTPLELAVSQLHARGCPAAPVIQGDSLLGLLNLQNASELLAVRSALARFRNRPR